MPFNKWKSQEAKTKKLHTQKKERKEKRSGQ